MIKISKWTSLASLAILALPLALTAQEEGADDAPAPLSDVWMIVVKSGMQAEFDAAMETHIRFRNDAGESRDWQGYRVAVGHNMAPIQMRSCCFNWADFDVHAAEITEKGLRADFTANVAPYVDHIHHYVESSDWENSHWPEEGTSGPYYAVTSWTIKQGRGPESSDAKGKMSQLAKEEGWASDDNNWLWLSRTAGGDAMTMLVSSYDNYADMEPPEQSFYEFVVEQIGEVEADEMFNDFGGGFDDSDYTIWVHDPGISTPADDDAEE